MHTNCVCLYDCSKTNMINRAFHHLLHGSIENICFAFPIIPNRSIIVGLLNLLCKTLHYNRFVNENNLTFNYRYENDLSPCIRFHENTLLQCHLLLDRHPPSRLLLKKPKGEIVSTICLSSVAI